MTDIVPQTNPLESLIPMVLDSVNAPTSKKNYQNALRGFLGWCREEGRPFTKATVNAWRCRLQERGLSASTVNVQLSAIRKLAAEAADNGLLDYQIASGIDRVEGVKRLGVRTGNWLTLEQAQELLRRPLAGTRKGLRDRAVLSLLLGCGLRRQELVALTVGHLGQRDGRWVLVDLVGKGGRIRTVPVPGWAYQAVQRWLDVSGITEGKIFCGLRSGIMTSSLSGQSVHKIVSRYAEEIGVSDIAPHDLRRSFARLCRSAGAELDQLQFSLGHASVKTTELYVGCQQDLQNSPGDRLQLS